MSSTTKARAIAENINFKPVHKVSFEVEVEEASLIESLQDAGYVLFSAEEDGDIAKYLQGRDTYVCIPTDGDGEDEAVIAWLSKKGYQVNNADETKELDIIVQDEASMCVGEIKEEVERLYAIHGLKLAQLLRSL